MNRSGNFKRVLQAACLCGAAMLVTACTTTGDTAQSNGHLNSAKESSVAKCCLAHGTANAKACCKTMEKCCMVSSKDKNDDHGM